MNDHIILEMDENGGYVVDIIGLVYLLKKKMIPENSEVLSVLKSGYEVSYIVCQEEGSYFLMVDDDELYEETIDSEVFLSTYFELDEDVMSATYYVETAVSEDEWNGSFDDKPQIHYQNIHYEEALTRMKNGETVYLDYEKYDMKEFDGKMALSPGMVMDGLWFVSEETKGLKAKPANAQKAFKKESLQELAPDDQLSLLLKEYFAKHERNVWSTEKPKPTVKKEKKSKESEEAFMENLLGMSLLSFLMSQDFDGDVIDFNDYI